MTSNKDNVNERRNIDNNIMSDISTKCMSNVFKDRDGTYSVRKFGGYSAIILIIYLVISYTIAHGFKEEIPTAYVTVIGVIIAFYFAKDSIRNIGIKSAGRSDASGLNE